MEIDNLKDAWNNLNDPAADKPILTTKSIDQMTQKKFRNKIKKIIYPEHIGIAICLLGAMYTGLNFNKLDTFFLQSVGVVTIIILLALSAISFISTNRFNHKNLEKPYAETIKNFALQKIQFYKLQKINIMLAYLLLVTTIILFSKFIGGNNITTNKYFWIFSFSFGYIFLLFYSRWVFKFYQKALRDAEEELGEMG